jgi:ferredoxin
MKIAGASALGIAGAAQPTTELLAQDTKKLLKKAPPLRAKRWAMVIDLNKCHEADDCNDCIFACNKAHNVPQFDNAKDEVKWIWKESFRHSFHEQENEYTKKDLAHGPVLLLCNHCDNPGDVETGRGRHRHDGLAPVYRLPVLRGRLSLRVEELQLARSAAVPEPDQRRVSHQNPRSRREMQLLRGTAGQG